MTRTAAEPIRWAVIATGSIAGSFVADLQATADAEVVAVASRSRRRARAFAEQRGIPAAFDDVAAMLAAGGVDVVYVATPHPQHVAPTRSALESGVAVLCEKPLSADLASAAELVALSRARGVLLAEAMWMRCDPLVVGARDLVADGAIGELRTITASLGFPAAYDPGGRLWSAELGGGALLDVGVYPVAFARAFLPAAPTLVDVAGTLARNGVDADAQLTLEHVGVRVDLACSLTTALPSGGTLTGTEGEIHFGAPLYRTARRTWTRSDGTREVAELDPSVPTYGHEIAEVHRCLREGRTESPLLPLDETLEVLTVLDAARQRLGAG